MSTSEKIWSSSYPEGISWDQPIDTKPLFHLLDETAKNHGDRPGFDFLGKKYSWAEIDLYSRKLAKGFQDMGIKKGDHVGLLLPNCPYFIFSFYGLLRIGAVVVHYNPLYTKSEIARLIEDSETDYMLTVDFKLTFDPAKALLSESRLKSVIVCPFAEALPPVKKFFFSLLKRSEVADIPDDNPQIIPLHSLLQNDGAYAPVDINPEEDNALLQFTGGTTGIPKAATLTHANLFSNTQQCCIWFKGAKIGEERIAAVLPFFHVFAMTAILNLGTKLAMEIYALPRFELKAALKLIQKEKITFFPAVPAIYTAINNFPRRSWYDLSSITTCISGGAPLPVEVKKDFEAKTGCVLVEGYGLSETSPVVCVNPIDRENKPGSIGLPLPQTDVILIDVESGEHVHEFGERGEICIKGPQVMKGYYKNKAETDSTIKNGYLHTGDVATMDKDGYFFIVDRIKDLIITNGYNVYPRMVEDAIYLHPAIEECIVAGIPDEKRGEAVKAWIKLKDGRSLSDNDMKAFLQDKLSPLEMPRHIEFRVEPLPKTMIGKLSRKDILEEEKAKQS